MDEVYIFDGVATVNDVPVEVGHLTPEGGEVATYEAAMVTCAGIEYPDRFNIPLRAFGRIVRHTFSAFYDEDGKRRINHDVKDFVGVTRWGLGCTARAEDDLHGLWVEYMLWTTLMDVE